MVRIPRRSNLSESRNEMPGTSRRECWSWATFAAWSAFASQISHRPHDQGETATFARRVYSMAAWTSSSLSARRMGLMSRSRTAHPIGSMPARVRRGWRSTQ
jgi:hypothetical protein